jgi:CRP/FNR family transcriptional regulator
MPDASLCVSCPNHEHGFCGALLGSLSKESQSREGANWQHYRTVRPGEQIVTRNQASDNVFVVCSGWAFRFFQLPNGRRQILNFLLPGDLFSAAAVFAERFHFSVKALTETQLSGFRRAEVQARCAVNPDIGTALANACIAEANGADELLTALGQRSAEERIAYLFLHLQQRIAAQSVIREQRYRFPLRQQHIADAVGLTPVHVSRVLGLFRERGIVELSDGVLKVFNLPELERIGSLN